MYKYSSYWRKTMQLTQSEIIQVLRKRAGLNQAELGSRAFNTTVESGRTKIKNIELGKQHASTEDLKCIARSLDVSPEQLQPRPGNKDLDPAPVQGGILISKKIADMFPGLRDYLDMLEKASMIDDSDLIVYLSDKIADIWQNGPKMVNGSQKRNITTVELS
jgi:transcriptional regulator with XRE-family HTH domain